jgi:hypothetical protein
MTLIIAKKFCGAPLMFFPRPSFNLSLSVTVRVFHCLLAAAQDLILGGSTLS